MKKYYITNGFDSVEVEVYPDNDGYLYSKEYKRFFTSMNDGRYYEANGNDVDTQTAWHICGEVTDDSHIDWGDIETYRR